MAMFCNPELREARLARLRDIMTRLELDALILTTLENVRYATDFRPLHGIFFVSNYVAIIKPTGKPLLLAPEADGVFIKNKLPWLDWLPLPSFVPSATGREDQAELMFATLGKNIKRIGFDVLSIQQFHSLNNILKAEFVPVADEILYARARKMELEVEILERATQFAEIGMEAVRNHLRPGVPEFELVAEAIYAIKRSGAEAESHLPAIRSGENAAIQQRVDSDAPVRPGDSVIVDLGARFLGYSAEYCRTMVVGRPNRKLREMYKVLFEAYWAGIEEIKPGVPVASIDQTIRRIITKAGYPDYPHATGHGIGMSNVEYPTINKTCQDRLEEGMVICLEPGIYVPGIGGVKEEDIILVTSTGRRLLTQTPYDEHLRPT